MLFETGILWLLLLNNHQELPIHNAFIKNLIKLYETGIFANVSITSERELHVWKK